MTTKNFTWAPLGDDRPVYVIPHGDGCSVLGGCTFEEPIGAAALGGAQLGSGGDIDEDLAVEAGAGRLGVRSGNFCWLYKII